MGRKVDVDDLVGAAEIAKRLGLASAGLVNDWRRRYPDFPAPLAELNMGNVWSWEAVAAWAKSTGRLR